MLTKIYLQFFELSADCRDPVLSHWPKGLNMCRKGAFKVTDQIHDLDLAAIDRLLTTLSG